MKQTFSRNIEFGLSCLVLSATQINELLYSSLIYLSLPEKNELLDHSRRIITAQVSFFERQF